MKNLIHKYKYDSLFVNRWIVFLCLLFPTSLLPGQAGALDLTFNTTDQGFGYAEGPGSSVNATVIQSDGQVLIGGGFTSYHGTLANRIARLNTDGSLDGTFNSGTGFNSTVTSIGIQNDGKIIVSGLFTSYDGVPRNRIARLNIDGSLDLTFIPGAGPDNFIQSINVQSDGRIVLGGSFTTYDGISRNRIARLNTNGSIDLSFNPGVGANNQLFTTSIQSDGKIVIGGSFTSYDGTGRNGIARLNADGSLDLSFNPGTGANNDVHTIALQGDGKILLGGRFTIYNGTSRVRIARVNADGSVDSSFNPGGGANNTVSTSVLQSDGKLIIGGNLTNFSGFLRRGTARLNLDGSLDFSYNPGQGAENFVQSIALQADGKVIVGGAFLNYNNTSRKFVVRVQSNGNLDTSFNPNGTGANGAINEVKIQSNGKILIGGSFSGYDSLRKNCVTRLIPNGNLDAFVAGTNGSVTAIAQHSDGQIIIGGSFTICNGITRNRIARLDALGFNDPFFNPGIGVNSTVHAVALQSDGKIIISGDFSNYNGVTRTGIARVNTNGSLDATFDPGAGANGSIRSLAIQGDGKIIIGGIFTSYNGTARNRIARLNPDGSLDASFNPGTGADHNVMTCVILPDGKIFIGGWFNSYNGTSRKQLARLNADGSLDLTFNSLLESGNYVTAIAVQVDDRILVGGSFASYNGSSRNNIVRIYSDGTLDTTFDPGSGANDAIECIAIQDDDRIIIAGYFTGYNGTGRHRIARLWSDEDADGDGTANVNDGCPFDAAKLLPGQCGCGFIETDTDADGTADCIDGCPTDPDKTAPGQCGCNMPDLDDDCDGVANCNDVCPNGDDTVDNDFDGNPDCKVYPGFNFLPALWTCSNNNNAEKVLICHDGSTLCVSENSLAQHLAHGDNIGPCQSCTQEMIQMPNLAVSQAEGQYEVYPNPTSDEIHVRWPYTVSTTTLHLFDHLGRSLWQSEYKPGTTAATLNIDHQLHNGIYFLQIRQISGITTHPLVMTKS